MLFTEYLRKHLMDNRKALMESAKYKANEKKRPGKAKTHSDLFGMEGSFRQLNIDWFCTKIAMKWSQISIFVMIHKLSMP